MEWPGNSPDLNPIENLWCVMKNKVSEKHPTSLSALQLAIKEVWVKGISSDYCCKLIESMPCRLQEVIKNKEGHTKDLFQLIFFRFVSICRVSNDTKKLINYR